MVSFRENFFFFRFTVLFFILTIFGYWGLDLNSEELYIAFSFFVLVLIAFILVRNAVLFFFVKAINAKFSRILVDLLITVAALRLQLTYLGVLNAYINVFVAFLREFVVFLINFVNYELPIYTLVYTNRFNFLQAMVRSSAGFFSVHCFRGRKSLVFLGKFFDINL